MPDSNLLFCGYEVIMSNLLGNLLIGNHLNKIQRLSRAILRNESQQMYRKPYSLIQ